MYKIDKTKYGYRLTFGGFITKDEMEKWLEESKKILKTTSRKFGVFVDMRTLKPLVSEAQDAMKEGQKLYKQKGMERSVVILENAITTLQFKRIAQETGIYDWERYIDAFVTSDWERVGLDWLTKAIDPDKV